MAEQMNLQPNLGVEGITLAALVQRRINVPKGAVCLEVFV